MSDFTYRTATEADAPLMARIGAQTFADTFGHLYSPDNLAAFLENHSVENWATELNDPSLAVRLAEQDGAVVGHLLCHLLRLRCGDARELLLYEIGVRANHRRRGVGRLLLDVMEGWMASAGHCENILNPGLTELGVGVNEKAASLGSGMSGTWTQDFGLPRGASPRSSDTGPQHGCPYQHLKGIDAAGNVTAAKLPVAGTAKDVGKLRVEVRHRGSNLIVRGHINAGDGTKVRLTILRHGHLAAWGTAPLVNGRFAFRVPRGIGDRFIIRVAGKRVSRALR